MNLVIGTYAALIVPRDNDGKLDEASLRREMEFLLEQGIRGLVVNGATGEYCLTTTDELRRMLAIARETTAGRTDYCCAIGSASVRGCIERGRIAELGGAKGLLLPAPHFFPYEQEDLDAFCREVAAAVSLPILLYNLPQFTRNIFQPQTAMNLFREVPGIVGIKDSSGSLDILRDMTREGLPNRIVGNDGVLAQALREGLCDGVISGVACAAPELLLALFDRREDPESTGFRQAAASLAQFIERLDRFPTPWGLKWIQECRGIAPASFSQPLSEHRIAQGRDFQEWFREWGPGAGIGPCPAHREDL
jgi:4-hydroxy-tetrahydrodipicolinate synthase